MQHANEMRRGIFAAVADHQFLSDGGRPEKYKFYSFLNFLFEMVIPKIGLMDFLNIFIKNLFK